MSKTPEEMAEEYRENHDECEFARDAFLAGYQAAKDQVADAGKVMTAPPKEEKVITSLDEMHWPQKRITVEEAKEMFPDKPPKEEK